MHLSCILEEMGGTVALPFDLRSDNTTCIAFSKGNVRRSKLKHIDVRQQWVEWLRDRNVVSMSHVGTKINPADFFTKILDFETFDRFRSLMVVDRPMDDDRRARL